MKEKPMTLKQLRDRLDACFLADQSIPVLAEHYDLGQGGNVKSKIIDLVIENNQVILITDSAV